MNVPASGFGRSCSMRSTTDGARRVGKAGQLVQRLLSVEAASRTADQANQRRPLGTRSMPAIARSGSGTGGCFPVRHLSLIVSTEAKGPLERAPYERVDPSMAIPAMPAKRKRASKAPARPRVPLPRQTGGAHEDKTKAPVAAPEAQDEGLRIEGAR